MDKSYRDLFFAESQEYLKDINKALVQLENNPLDYESLNLIFRLMHTLKGMAATMGYSTIADFAHHLEDAFDMFRTDKVKLIPAIMDVVFESIDAFANLIECVRNNQEPLEDIKKYFEKIEAILPKQREDSIFHFRSEPVEKSAFVQELDVEHIRRLKAQGKNIYNVKIYISRDCSMKSVRAFLALDRLKKAGEVLQVIPDESILKEEKFDNFFELIFATNETDLFIKKELSKLMEVEKTDVCEVDVSLLKKDAGAAVIKKIQSMRIPVERLDKIMNLMGELAIAKSRLVQNVQLKNYPSLEETSFAIEHLVSSLQDEALKLRLLPISHILDNFPRIIRDMARKNDKEVDLEIMGSEIELDRVILDEIGDPLIHLIRNSIDHGIESSEERVKAGKPIRGKIFIKISREKGHIIIHLGDDGRGINLNNIAGLAVEKGMISAEDAAHIDKIKILDILAAPGFSTKKEVTDLSGRGVGLDVVKTKIEFLGGRLDFETEEGKGTKFILILPLSLAIIKAMLVQIGEEIYAVPLMNIKETVKIKKTGIKLIKDVEVIQLREEIISIIRLDKEFGIKSYSNEKDDLSIVIVEGRAKNVGLTVDKVLGEQDIVVKPLGSFIKKIKGVAGSTILGDGRVVLILDIVNLR